MKYPLPIFTAAAAAVASIIRVMVGDDASTAPEPTGPSPIPQITPRLVEKMAFTGGTDSEIADRFLIEETVLRTKYRNVLRVARALRKMHIRSLQLELARKLNAATLIWLGRNELGQSVSPSKSTEDDPDYEANEFN